MATSCAFQPGPSGGQGVPSSVDDGWWLPFLVAAEAIFTLSMIVLGHVSKDDALTAAGGASALATAATYLRPALLQVGTRLGLRAQDHSATAPRQPLLPRLAVLVSLELAVVAAGVLCAGLDTSGAVRLAAGITVLCTAICQGQPALLAMGRRMFPQDNLGR